MSRPHRVPSHRVGGRVARMSMACLLAFPLFCLVGAGTGAIKKLTVDPNAPVVEMFDGIKAGQVDVRLTAMNATEGRVFVTNKTDKPLTIAAPKALVGVHILPQAGNNFGNGLFGPGNNKGNNNGNGANAQGQGQSVGGVLGAVGNGNGNGVGNGNANGFGNGFGGFGNLPGNNLFSIPPEKTVQLSFRSVCLNHGRPDPTSGMKYQVVKVESYTTDPVLQQLIENDSSKTSRDVQQAAAWHLANGMSWSKLASLTKQHIPGVMTPLFTKTDLNAAKALVETAQKDAEKRPAKTESSSSLVTSVGK